MPEDRWERSLLQGALVPAAGDVSRTQRPRDPWWERVGFLLKEVFGERYGAPGWEWYVVAADKEQWRG
eukprot:11891976-Alexandrium_andersonii.AAC.1